MRKFYLGLKVNSSYISLVFSETLFKSTFERMVFRTVERKECNCEILDNDTVDKIEEQIQDVEKEFSRKVSDIYFCFPQDKVRKIIGSSQRILHPRNSLPLSVSEIRKSIEQALLLNVDWTYNCIHSFPLEFKLDGKVFRKPPFGVYGRRFEVKVLFYVCNKDYILNLDKVFQRLGRNYTKLVLSSLAEVSSLREKELTGKNFALLNFGENKLEISCFRDFILEDTAVIYKGGRFIDEQISQELNIPVYLSGELKISYGSLLNEDLKDERAVTIKRVSSYRQIKREVLNSIIISSYRKILEQVRDYLERKDFLRVIDYLIPLGGGTKIKGFDKIAESILFLPIKRVDSYISNLVKDESKFLASFGVLKFPSSKFNIENSYRFPNTLLRRIKNILEDYF